MYAYRIALFLHLVALILAAGATAVTKLAAGRQARARTIGELLEWHGTLMAASKLFPIALLVFLLTGGYMLSISRIAVWSTGFIVAGLLGVALLFASGTFLGIKGNAFKQVLEKIAAEGRDRLAPRMVPPTLVAILPIVNTGIALSVVFDMVTKPASIPVALAIVLVGVLLSLGGALMGLRAAARASALSVQQSGDASRAA